MNKHVKEAFEKARDVAQSNLRDTNSASLATRMELRGEVSAYDICARFFEELEKPLPVEIKPVVDGYFYFAQTSYRVYCPQCHALITETPNEDGSSTHMPRYCEACGCPLLWKGDAK